MSLKAIALKRIFTGEGFASEAGNFWRSCHLEPENYVTRMVQVFCYSKSNFKLRLKFTSRFTQTVMKHSSEKK